MARLFLLTGAVLAVAGLALWFILPIATLFPPYVATALLALGYGAACLRGARPPSAGKT